MVPPIHGQQVVLLDLAEKRAYLGKSLVDLVGGVAGSALHLWTIGRVGVTGRDEDIVQRGQLDWSSQNALALEGISQGPFRQANNCTRQGGLTVRSNFFMALASSMLLHM